jgi:hypothetical protein
VNKKGMPRREILDKEREYHKNDSQGGTFNSPPDYAHQPRTPNPIHTHHDVDKRLKYIKH